MAGSASQNSSFLLTWILCLWCSRAIRVEPAGETISGTKDKRGNKIGSLILYVLFLTDARPTTKRDQKLRVEMGRS
ncbi:hypothetical protein Agabi119p4_1170 [Agaricus bisporus var. burnettii]|uniref:Secreted protein n=1 Tax=Agaricus bisporus var. burnettii TaxID=192524 RepID=A0A8H7KLG0_AGABI|nr:hypothetical protein Agabi119p4_1170 [Agaricus bisporus var. burnettii]